MTVGYDNHLWHAKELPSSDESTLFLSEMAGPRAIHRTVLMSNESDVGITYTLCYQSDDVDVYPEFLRVHLPAGYNDAQAVFASERGLFDALGTKSSQVKGDAAVLGGSCPGIQIWIEPDTTPTKGFVYAEISLQYDS